MVDITLHFDGPFIFSEGNNSVYHAPNANSAGIYLWTIRQVANGSHLIHYIGETVNLARRHQEHLIQILGLNYGIFDPDDARVGKCTFLWRGMWRDKSTCRPAKLIAEYPNLAEVVIRYVNEISIFFAELDAENKLRKHIEGCIGWNLRKNHKNFKQLYPDDNHLGILKENKNGRLLISANQTILGLDPIIEY